MASIKDKLLNLLIVFLTLFVFELIFGFYFLIYKTESISIIFKPLVHTNFNPILQTFRDQNYDFNTKKYIPGTYKFGDIEFHMNSRGFRGPEYVPKDQNECLGITYGGSTTVAIDVTYEETFQRRLEKKMGNCRFLNFGVSSKSLKYIFDRISTEFREYNPDYTIINSNRNSAAYDTLSQGIAPDVFTNKISYAIFKSNVFLEDNLMSFRFFKRLYLRIKQTKEGIPHPYDMSRSINLEYLTSEYFELLEQIYHFIKKDSKLILVKQIVYINPEIQKRLQNNTIDENINYLNNYQNINFITMKIDESLGKEEIKDNYFMLTNIILNKQLDKLKEKYSDVIVVDPLDEFYKYDEKETTVDGIHLNALGSEILANEIHNAISKLSNDI